MDNNKYVRILGARYSAHVPPYQFDVGKDGLGNRCIEAHHLEHETVVGLSWVRKDADIYLRLRGRTTDGIEDQIIAIKVVASFFLVHFLLSLLHELFPWLQAVEPAWVRSSGESIIQTTTGCPDVVQLD